MALRPLDQPPSVGLGSGWELLASEAGRSSKGLLATVTLLNGTPQDRQTLALGDAQAQQALAATCASRTGFDGGDVLKALMQLSYAVDGVLRQMETQQQTEDDHPSQATRLVKLAINAGAELFHTPGADGEAFATIGVDGHKETWPLRVRRFRRWLADLFNDEEDKVPGSQAVHDALAVLEGKALKGQECPVFLRLAEYQGALYLDLGNPAWQAVEITSRGWQVLDAPPVKFRRTRGMLPLPVPVPGGSLADLRAFLNLRSDEDWRLLVAWLLAMMRPTGPYPVLVIYGEQGSAKSTQVRVLRSLVDPNTAALRTTPRDERDLVIAANNGWLIALDNLSHLPDWLSDALCRLATGSGFATRELYTDAEEVIFAAQRPIALNGIEELGTRGDLLDRAILLYLPTIPEEQRQHEQAFWARFEAARPHLLGALLAIVSQGLQALPSVQLTCLPRMADFARWAYATAAACGWSGQAFLDAYQGAREAAHDLTLEASPVGGLLRQFMTQRTTWTDTASALLAELEQLAAGGPTGQGSTMKAGSDVTKQKAWPKNGRALSNALRRLAPTLRAVGIDVQHTREDGTGKRLLKLTALAPQTPPSAASSGPTGSPQGPPPGRVQGTI